MKYLSFGGGVNSTALLIHLEEKGEKFEAIFVNHGGDWPETYEYVGYLRDQGYGIKELIPNEAGCKTIIEYCYKYHIIPGMQRRFCTDHFKLRPINRYIKKPCIMYIGMSKGEEKRTRESGTKSIKNKYPLIEAGITRDGCKALIRSSGLREPPRSGCYFCPYITKADARRLWRTHPDLFMEVVQLEKDCNSPGHHIKAKGVSFEQFADIHTSDLNLDY